LALAGRLLAQHADAPRICIAGGRIALDLDQLSDRAMVDFQLATQAPRDEVRAVALWADRLHAAVEFALTNSGVRVTVTADIDGVRVEVWNSLTAAELLTVLPGDLAARCLTGATVAPADLLAALPTPELVLGDVAVPAVR